ncbi:zincin-like metallopeptidase domain-containing protein [Proteus vulgaris]
MQGHLQHKSYIASWLKTLKEDHKTIFRVARYAKEAFEYLILNTNKK